MSETDRIHALERTLKEIHALPCAGQTYQQYAIAVGKLASDALGGAAFILTVRNT